MGGCPFLIEGDRKGLELLECARSPTDHVLFDLEFEASVEGGGEYLLIGELGVQGSFGE